MMETLLQQLPALKDFHSRGGSKYNAIYKQLQEYVLDHYSVSYGCDLPIDFGDIALTLPYFKMGTCNTINLFNLDEMILLSFYWHNKNRYSSVVDIGANVGLHSIFMEKCGFKVSSYEPDEKHYNELVKNLKLNNCNSVDVHKKAVSNNNGIAKFIRILDNTTSSHVEGSKDNVYGPTEVVEVPTVNVNDILDGVDLVKIDAEGHEATILESLNIEAFDSLDMVLEVGSSRNAKIIFDKFSGNCNILSQKLNWNPIDKMEDIPVSYKEGSLFISRRFDSFYEKG